MTDATPLPTTDQTATLIDTTVVDIVNAEITVAETALTTQYPFLGFWYLKWAWKIPFKYFLSQLGLGLGKLSGYVVIDIQKYFAMKKALQAQGALDAAKKTGDLNAINQASADVDAAVAPILHYIGTA